MRILCVAALSAGALSCAAPGTGGAGPPPLAWRLVSDPCPGGTELTLEAYDPTGDLKIEIRFSRDWASVGEMVEAELRLPEETGAHRLEVVPDRPGVEILGPREVWTDGARPVRVRFTCRKPGRGGVTVRLRD